MTAWLGPFEWAVVRLATFARRTDAAPKLVFGTVSLLPPDRPRPPSDLVVSDCPLKGSKGCLFYKRVVMRAPDAVAWYRSAPDAFTTPVPTDPEERKPHDGRPIAGPDLL